MSTIKFGMKQFTNPTPANWSNAINVFTVIVSILIGWLGTVDFIPAHTSTVIQSVGGLLLAIANGLKPFIGVETSKTTVPIEQVGEMDTTKK